ncbi:TPA: cobalt transporter, partial [Escherichia coli]|nr:cobalt transporter [Escherichia coli]
ISSKPIISIIMDIAYRNPKLYPVSFAILSKFLTLLKEDKERLQLLKLIFDKFKKLPNINYFELWLQRAIGSDMQHFKFNGELSQIVVGENPQIWNSEWIASSKILRIISDTPLVNFDKLRMVEPIIEPEEFDLFPEKSL